MENLMQDLRYGLRVLLNKPGFTLTAVLALALGIGANSAIFSVVNAVLLRPLPYENPDRLVWVWGRFSGGDQASTSPPDFLDYRAQNRSLEQLCAFMGMPFNIMGGDAPEQVAGASVTANFFQTLGVQPKVGRAFLPEEEQVDRPQAVILSHGLWERRFGADPSLLGKTLTIDGQSMTVVGILPPHFRFFRPVELWVPIPFANQGMQVRRTHFLRPIARLKPNVTLEQAQADLDIIAARLAQQYPDSNAGWNLRLVPLQEMIVGNIRPALLVLLASVAFVLLIACANVGSLLLARAATRQREFAIRTTLGAGRMRLIRQLLTESIMLSFLGGGIGILLALWGLDILAALGPANVPRLREINVDGRVLGFTLGVSLLTGFIFGLVPALQASRPDLNDSLKEGGRTFTASLRHHHARALLVVSEIALALVLLIGAGLMVKSFIRLQQVDPGFNPDKLLTMRISLPAAKYLQGGERAANFFEQILRRVETLPGVQSVGMVTELPLSGQLNDTYFTIEGRPPQNPGEKMLANFRRVNAGYFRTMGIPLRKGRYFTEPEAKTSAKVVTINETMARLFFPDEDPIGKHLVIDVGQPLPLVCEIVGVVGDVKHFDLRVPNSQEMYIPSLGVGGTNLVVRTAADPLSLAAAVRGQVLALDKDQPVSNIRSMQQILSNSVGPQRFSTLLISLFALLALILAAVGIYGVMSYSVNQRTHEIGIRMAMGAQARDVLRLVVGQGMLLAAVGLAIGLTAALMLTRLLSRLLFSVSAADPATYTVISMLLAGVVLLASYIPARRATKVDPMIALRYE